MYADDRGKKSTHVSTEELFDSGCETGKNIL